MYLPPTTVPPLRRRMCVCDLCGESFSAADAAAGGWVVGDPCPYNAGFKGTTRACAGHLCDIDCSNADAVLHGPDSGVNPAILAEQKIAATMLSAAGSAVAAFIDALPLRDPTSPCTAIALNATLVGLFGAFFEDAGLTDAEKEHALRYGFATLKSTAVRFLSGAPDAAAAAGVGGGATRHVFVEIGQCAQGSQLQNPASFPDRGKGADSKDASMSSCFFEEMQRVRHLASLEVLSKPIVGANVRAYGCIKVKAGDPGCAQLARRSFLAFQRCWDLLCAALGYYRIIIASAVVAYVDDGDVPKKLVAAPGNERLRSLVDVAQSELRWTDKGRLEVSSQRHPTCIALAYKALDGLAADSARSSIAWSGATWEDWGEFGGSGGNVVAAAFTARTEGLLQPDAIRKLVFGSHQSLRKKQVRIVLACLDGGDDVKKACEAFYEGTASARDARIARACIAGGIDGGTETRDACAAFFSGKFTERQKRIALACIDGGGETRDACIAYSSGSYSARQKRIARLSFFGEQPLRLVSFVVSFLSSTLVPAGHVFGERQSTLLALAREHTSEELASPIGPGSAAGPSPSPFERAFSSSSGAGVGTVPAQGVLEVKLGQTLAALLFDEHEVSLGGVTENVEGTMALIGFVLKARFDSAPLPPNVPARPVQLWRRDGQRAFGEAALRQFLPLPPRSPAQVVGFTRDAVYSHMLSSWAEVLCEEAAAAGATTLLTEDVLRLWLDPDAIWVASNRIWWGTNKASAARLFSYNAEFGANANRLTAFTALEPRFTPLPGEQHISSAAVETLLLPFWSSTLEEAQVLNETTRRLTHGYPLSNVHLIDLFVRYMVAHGHAPRGFSGVSAYMDSLRQVFVRIAKRRITCHGGSALVTQNVTHKPATGTTDIIGWVLKEASRTPPTAAFPSLAPSSSSSSSSSSASASSSTAAAAAPAAISAGNVPRPRPDLEFLRRARFYAGQKGRALAEGGLPSDAVELAIPSSLFDTFTFNRPLPAASGFASTAAVGGPPDGSRLLSGFATAHSAGSYAAGEGGGKNPRREGGAGTAAAAAPLSASASIAPLGLDNDTIDLTHSVKSSGGSALHDPSSAATRKRRTSHVGERDGERGAAVSLVAAAPSLVSVAPAPALVSVPPSSAASRNAASPFLSPIAPAPAPASAPSSSASSEAASSSLPPIDPVPAPATAPNDSAPKRQRNDGTEGGGGGDGGEVEDIVQCDACAAWRLIDGFVVPIDGSSWTCRDNTSVANASCEDPSPYDADGKYKDDDDDDDINDGEEEGGGGGGAGAEENGGWGAIDDNDCWGPQPTATAAAAPASSPPAAASASISVSSAALPAAAMAQTVAASASSIVPLLDP